jgi:hypothetical protein
MELRTTLATSCAGRLLSAGLRLEWNKNDTLVTRQFDAERCTRKESSLFLNFWRKRNASAVLNAPDDIHQSILSGWSAMFFSPEALRSL